MVINAALRTTDEIIQDAFDKALIIAKEKANKKIKYNKRVKNRNRLRRG